MPPLHDEQANEDEYSVREHLNAAFKTSRDQDDEPSDDPAAQSAEQNEEPADEVAGEKVESAGKEKSAPAPDKAEEDRPLDPPAKWSKEEKEAFAALDPNIQRILSTRNKSLEGDYTRKMQEIAQERQRYQGLEQVLGPRREVWQRAGMSDEQALNSIMSYWDLANRDPMQFIDVFTRERGIDLRSAFSPSQEEIAQMIAQYSGDPELAESYGQDQVHPQIAARLDSIAQENAQLREYVQQLGGTLTSQQQAQQQEMQRNAQQALTSFASETDQSGQPLHPFFEDVREDMAYLLRAERAKDLKEAYEMAVRMNPNTYGKLEESREVMRRREEERRRQEEAARAKRAGASVAATSSAPPPPDDDEEDLSVRGLLRAGFQRARQQGRV